MKLVHLALLSVCLFFLSCSTLERAPRSENIERALSLSAQGELDAAIEIFESECEKGFVGACLAIGEQVEIKPQAHLNVLQLETSDRQSVIRYQSPDEELRAFIWDQEELRLFSVEKIEFKAIIGGEEIVLTGLRPGRIYRLDLYAPEGSFVSSHTFSSLATEGVELKLSLGPSPCLKCEARLLFDEARIWERELTPTFLVQRILGNQDVERIRLRGLDYYFVSANQGLSEMSKNKILDMMSKSRRGAVVVSTSKLAEGQSEESLYDGLKRQVRAPVIFMHKGPLTTVGPRVNGILHSYNVEVSSEADKVLNLQTSLGVLKGQLGENFFEVEVK